MNTPQQRLAHEGLLEAINTASAFKKYQKHNAVLPKSTSTADEAKAMYCVPHEAPEPSSFVQAQQSVYDAMGMKMH